MLESKFWQAFFALTPLIFTLIILFGLGVFLLTVFSEVPRLEADPDRFPYMIFSGLGTFLAFVFLGIILSLASLVYYIIHAASNPSLQSNGLVIVWILLFIFIGGIAQFLYWIIEIINKRDRETPQASTS